MLLKRQIGVFSRRIESYFCEQSLCIFNVSRAKSSISLTHQYLVSTKRLYILPEVFYKKKFLKIWQNSHDNNCARVTFLIKSQALRRPKPVPVLAPESITKHFAYWIFFFFILLSACKKPRKVHDLYLSSCSFTLCKRLEISQLIFFFLFLTIFFRNIGVVNRNRAEPSLTYYHFGWSNFRRNLYAKVLVVISPRALKNNQQGHYWESLKTTETY